MSVVIIKLEVQVVDDEVLRKLAEKNVKEMTGLEEIPELPGVCFRSIVGCSRSDEAISSAPLLDLAKRANNGEIPSYILLVNKS